MSVGIGSKSVLAYAEETVFGSFPTALAGVGLGFNSESIQNARNSFVSEEVNRARNVTAIRSGNVSAGGDITCELSPNALGIFFKHLLTCAVTTAAIVPTALAVSTAVTRGSYYTSNGRVYLCTRAGTTSANAVTTGLTGTDTSVEEREGTAYFQYFAANATNLKKHTFAAGTTKPTGGISFEREAFLDTGSQFFRYVGGRVNTLALNVPQEGILTAALGMIFLDADRTTGTDNATAFASRTFPADEPFAGAQFILRIKPTGGSYSEDFSVSTMSLNVSNNYDSNIYTAGQTRRRDIVEGRRDVSGNLNALFEDRTKFNYFANESVVALEMTVNYNGQFFKAEMPYVKLTGGAPAPVVSGNGILSHSFEFRAFHPTGGAEITIELSNNTASY